jgi:hypothetical protein
MILCKKYETNYTARLRGLHIKNDYHGNSKYTQVNKVIVK